MNIFNIWKWPSELIDDIQQWRIVRKALKEPDVIHSFSRFKYQLRYDRIGRIYTVINVPEELYPFEKREMIWPWMLEQLRDVDDLLMRVRLNELVFPEVTRLPDYPSYLVVLTPSTESFRLGKLLRWLFNVGCVYFLFYIINILVVKYTGSTIIHLIKSLF